MSNEVKWLLKEKYFGKPGKNFDKDVERLNAGEPVDYVIGFTNFLGCKIDLSKRPLIPRPETEFWVERAIASVWAEKISGARCLDLFSGSGCIGVAILKHTDILRRSQVNVAKYLLCDIADSQARCIEQAKINCRINGILKKRYRIIKSNIFSNIKGKYDYIFANPPYIPTTRKNKVGKSVLKYEPKTALFGGEDGLKYIKIFLKQAPKFLNKGGKIFMEFDCIQKKQIEKLIKSLDYKKFEFYKDQYGKFRYVKIYS